MSDKTALGDRMKRLESVTRSILPPRSYSVLRCDGRAFHSLLKGAARPFDDHVMESMNDVGKALCEEIQGAVFAFVQSDECSVLFTDFDSTTTQAWFGGVVQKMTSVAASVATVAFNDSYSISREGLAGKRAHFDARVWTIADPVEVANYVLWRQRDCVRNSITMAAQACFSHKQLHGKSTGDMQEMLWSQHGINWNEYEDGAKRGRVVVKVTEEQDVSFVDKRTNETTTTRAFRSRWEAQAAPHFTANPDGWLAEVIPPMPSLTERRPA